MLEPESDLWAQVRYAYEHTDRPVGDICVEHGISSGTLRDRMRRWHWKRRRPPISRIGPPPVAVMPREYPALEGRRAAIPDSIRERNDPGRADFQAPQYRPTPPVFAGAQTIDPPPPGEGEDAAAIVPRLRGAVARVLPAIEATIARLAAEPQHPREMEQAGRALSALTRTLRELNALLDEHNARGGGFPDEHGPEDMDALRDEVARRIRAFVESRKQENGEAKIEET